MSFTPVLFLPAPLQLFGSAINVVPGSAFPFADFRVTPHYPAKSPLDDFFSLVAPGSDRFASEKYAFEIEEILGHWGTELQQTTAKLGSFDGFFDPQIRGSNLNPADERLVRDQYGISVTQRRYATEATLAGEHFLRELRNYFASLLAFETAEFQVVAIQERNTSPLSVTAEIRYALVGNNHLGLREQRIGSWQTEWVKQDSDWRAVEWLAREETVSRAKRPLFVDISTQAFGNIESYQQQMQRGVDYWRTVLDAASGVDVYGNQGIAVGDFDNDGFDDIYVCQPSGLPNRLYRNRGNGTFEDVTAHAGLDVLDATSCALFADFDNRGHQDLLVVTNGGPLLFVNDGSGRFSLKRDAFKFARAPQGTFTHAALADYDRDGRLDVYFCLYNYYAGLDQYRYPSPYFDARNGPPNFLFHNDGDWTFTDRTEASGLTVDNDRYSFACAWGDLNGDGWPDLYVANDFGRSNLYRDNRDGTFSSIAKQASVEDVGAGMSACWVDFDGDGRQDIYVANMWSAAGLRISSQGNFHHGDPEDVRAMYRRHARGNSLYKNLGNGQFRNVAAETNTEFGRWAWSSDSWDFDHDGYADIYIANGYISGENQVDLSSFFWRQVVGNSPARLSPSPDYEHGWNAINELIRSDRSWSGQERNVCFCNNRDGSFADISGISGLDFPDDSRAFALADFDHDGRLEIVLKNRTAPQMRLLRNQLTEIGNSVVFRLTGTKSNRDAIGAAVTVEVAGRSQSKYVQAGSGFLSQHTKELAFGIGDASGFVKASIRWPSKNTQVLERVPVNHRINVEEGSSDFRAIPFAAPPPEISSARDGVESQAQHVQAMETWLLEPLRAPAFSLPDVSGKTWDLHSIAGNKLLTFCVTNSAESLAQLKSLRHYKPSTSSLQILALFLDDPPDGAAIRAVATAERVPFPVLIATPEVTGIYNIVYRYLFDRHRDLAAPTSLLLDAHGMIVKVYQGRVDAQGLFADLQQLPHASAERQKTALPFPGTLYLGTFQRNDFTYGVAFFQRGYLEAATESFKQVIASQPDDAEAHYNLGTLYLRAKDFPSAHSHLAKAVELKPNHAEAWNNLGMLAAQEGHTAEAIHDFTRCIELRPDYVTGVLNLANLYRHEKQFAQAEQLLNRALDLEPGNPEVNYNLAMLYAQQDENIRAEQRFTRALELRPGYADALNNLGVLLVREQHYADAESKFRSCIQSNPNFDQAYLNLARLYVLIDQKDKAKEVLENLLRLQPEHAVAQRSLKVLQ